MKTWVLVADRIRGRVYEWTAGGLELVQSFDHPEGRIEDQSLEAGRPARSFDRHAQGRAAPDRGTSPHERAAFAFAGQLAAFLDRGRQQTGVSNIVLVAEPHLLGMLRQQLTPATAQIVIGSLTKDLHAVPDREIPRHLQGVVPLS